MAIDRILLKDFLMFTGQEFEASFIDGVNVFIGANATGKSTLLKCIYAACKFSEEKLTNIQFNRFEDYFTTSYKNTTGRQ